MLVSLPGLELPEKLVLFSLCPPADTGEDARIEPAYLDRAGLIAVAIGGGEEWPRRSLATPMRPGWSSIAIVVVV